MKSNPNLKTIVRNYPLLLKELVAALVAGSLVAFLIVALWLIVFPSMYLVLLLVVNVFVVLVLSYAAQRLILFPIRSRVRQGLGTFGISQWEDIGFRAGDHIELGAWFIRPGSETDGATIIFVHGLGGNRGELAREAAMLARHGYGALVIDLRNHGRSGKAVTTLGYHEVEDVYGAVAYLLSRPEVNSERIAIFGHSMGAATAICAAARVSQIRAVIAQSAFTTLAENIEAGVTAQLGLPPIPFVPLISWMGERTTGLRISQVRPLSDVEKISPRAIMFIHGREDTSISPDNSRRLYAAAYEPKVLYLVDGADHKTPMLANPEQYEKRVVEFLDRYLLDQRVRIAQGMPESVMLKQGIPL